MDKLDKAIESICEDCESWIITANCRECLFNVFRRFDKYPPFSCDDEEDEEIWDRNSDTRTK